MENSLGIFLLVVFVAYLIWMVYQYIPRRFKGKALRMVTRVSGATGLPTEDQTAKEPVCDCGNHLAKGGKFYEGPSGGFSVNIQCALCGQWWNYANAFGDVIMWDRLDKDKSLPKEEAA